jgi:hypothetical protein
MVLQPLDLGDGKRSITTPAATEVKDNKRDIKFANDSNKWHLDFLDASCPQKASMWWCPDLL